MIYFITARDIGRVKIGYSAKPRVRFQKMQSDSPTRLALERVCDGDEAVEAALHERFAAFRQHGEWFTISAEIASHMATLPAPVIERKPREKRARLQGPTPEAAVLLSEIEAFCARNMLTATSVGSSALNDRPFVGQLRKGRRVWPETAEKVRAFMASYEAEARAA
jgi:hypothetical protein